MLLLYSNVTYDRESSPESSHNVESELDSWSAVNFSEGI